MIKRALILAAGQGQQIGDKAEPNCLVEVGGIPLLQRTLRTLARAGVRKVGITVGYRGVDIRRRVPSLVAADPAIGALEITFFDNDAWDRPNGLSVQAARAFFTERMLLVMADQISAPVLIEEMAGLPAAGPETVLCVDRDLARVFNIDDATRVRLDGERLAAISKTLSAYEAVSTGLFVASPTLLEALDALPEPSLTQAVQAAAERRLVVSHGARGRLWQDVDSPSMRQHAEWMLRVYGDELGRPALHGAPHSFANDTLALIGRLLAEKDAPGYTLFNPGPVMTSSRVKSALIHYDICHRDEDYSSVVKRLQAKLRPLFGAGPEHEMLLLTGSGTAAMEMALSSVVPEGRKLLVVANGAFGERLDEIAALHGMPRVVLRSAWGTLPDPEAVRAALAADADIAAVAMIHHETSVGLVNPIAAIGRACHERGVTLIVDAVSTLGAEDLDVVRDHVDVCYSSANKCLHSVSGVSFLCVAPHVWPRIADVAPRVYYLDMKRYRRYLQDLAQTPFTPAVSSFFALEAAIDELAERGGVPARRRLYHERNLRIRRQLDNLGFASYTNTGRESHTICTMRLPDFLRVDELYDGLKQRGFVIYRCKGALADRYVQISNMGELDDGTIDAFLQATTEVVETHRPAADRLATPILKSLP